MKKVLTQELSQEQDYLSELRPHFAFVFFIFFVPLLPQAFLTNYIPQKKQKDRTRMWSEDQMHEIGLFPTRKTIQNQMNLSNKTPQ
ncbi:hypothetical protein K445DRAFT_191010 [Daldinia sp. EC12]|nr:hypothetical protein K445DRAFT_191010 [Daldinia sp. EC12]